MSAISTCCTIWRRKGARGSACTIRCLTGSQPPLSRHLGIAQSVRSSCTLNVTPISQTQTTAVKNLGRSVEFLFLFVFQFSFMKLVSVLAVLNFVSISSGLSPSEAEYQFLSKAKSLELYGVNMHTVLVSLTNTFHSRQPNLT